MNRETKDRLTVALQALEANAKISRRVKDRIAAIAITRASPDQTAAAISRLNSNRRRNIQETRKTLDSTFNGVASRGRDGLSKISDSEWEKMQEE